MSESSQHTAVDRNCENQSTAIRPFSLYVHVPFCEQKCTYCDFFTITDPARRHPLTGSWLEICIRELELWREAGVIETARPISTIYFGGGTPSLLSPGAYAAFFEALHHYGFLISPGAEITLEIQPGTVDPAGFEQFVQAGFNRFSIGVQTFDPGVLAATGRRHGVTQTRDAIDAAQGTGQVVSVDLIGAWPDQKLSEYRFDLETALAYRPQHISVYELTFHPETALRRRLDHHKISELEEETRVAMFELADELITGAGYEHYEISNFAVPGFRSRHNSNYWQLGDFVGLGASAFSYLGGRRFSNPRNAERYAEKILDGRLAAESADARDADISVIENLQMALRIVEGVDLEWFEAHMGFRLSDDRMQKIKVLSEEGFLEMNGSTIRYTRAGRLRSDSILEYLL